MTTTAPAQTTSIHASFVQVGDTLITSRVEGKVIDIKRSYNRPLGGGGDICQMMAFTIEGTDEKVNRQRGEYLTVIQAEREPRRDAITKVDHDTVTAYMYRDCLIMANWRWNIRFRDGSGYSLDNNGIHCSTEDEYRAECMRIIDEHFAGELDTHIDAELLLEASFLTGAEIATTEADEVPLEVSHGVYTYRGHRIEAGLHDPVRHRTRFTITITRPDGESYSIESRRWGTRYDEQAKTAAQHIDSLLGG